MTTLAQAKSTTKISYEDFLEWLNEERHAEWVDGEIIEMSPVSNQHQDVVGFLAALLRVYAEARQLGEIRGEPYQMKPAVSLPGRAPDIFFVATAHLDRLKKTFLEGPADLVVEIISPESRVRDRGEKFFEYEQGGVSEYWLLDPLRQQVEFYQLSENGIYRTVPLDQEGRYYSAVLPGLWLQADWLWQTPLPPLLFILKAWELI